MTAVIIALPFRPLAVARLDLRETIRRYEDRGLSSDALTRAVAFELPSTRQHAQALREWATSRILHGAA